MIPLKAGRSKVFGGRAFLVKQYTSFEYQGTYIVYSGMRRVVKWFFGVVFLFAALVAGAYFLAKKYEEPVRNYIVGEVNKRLQAPMHVSDINFSFLEQFPSASLVFDSVWAEENIVKMGKPDTLFFFTKVYLNLNLFDILDGEYRINAIAAKDGFVHLMVDEKGYDNYHIWKTSEDTSGFLLELDKVHIERGTLHYINHVRDQDIRLSARELWFRGRFSDDNYTMAVKGDGVVHRLALKGINYLDERVVEVESDLDIVSSSETYSFRKGRFVIDNQLDFSVAGQLAGDGIDLRITGNDLDIIRSLSLIPIESRSFLEGYSSSGILDFDCTLKGAFGKTDNPRMKMHFALRDASIKKEGSRWKLRGLTGEGTLDNGDKRNKQTTVLRLDHLSGYLNNDPFETSFTVADFVQPAISGRAKMASDIAALEDFFEIPWLEEGEGRLQIEADIATRLSNTDSLSAKDFLNANASGFVRITGARLKLKDDERQYTIDSAHLGIVDNALAITYYSGKINDCAIVLYGKAMHFLDYVFTDEGRLQVSGKLVAGDVDMEALFPAREHGNSQNSVVVAFPKRADWDLEIVAGSFRKGGFEAREISGRLVMNAFRAEASQLHFMSQEGNVQGKIGLYRFAENQFGLRTDFTVKGVDIKKLFTAFDNFGQNFITGTHLAGVADADIGFQAFCDSTFSIDARSVTASVDLTVNNGAITGFEPLISVAEQIRDKKLLRLFIDTDELKKRLEDVRFATLHNEISIREGVITIPAMEISSSAIDMSISGTHTFDQHIHYEMDFAMSELLALKDRKEPYNEYVQRDPSGRTRVYMKITGTTEDFDVELERTNLKTTLREEVDTEKQTVKGLLREEFGVFGADSAAVAPPAEKKELRIEFDPEATGVPAGENEKKPGAAPSQQAREKGALNRFIKKNETDKKKLGEGEFEDDDF